MFNETQRWLLAVNGMLDHREPMIDQNPDTAPRQIEFFAARE
jgi:hypothetical protein